MGGYVQNEARLTGNARSTQDRGWCCGKSFKLDVLLPLFSMRMFGASFRTGFVVESDVEKRIASNDVYSKILRRTIENEMGCVLFKMLSPSNKH